MNESGTPHSPWHFRALSDYIARVVHSHGKMSARQAPQRMTRRQELLAAQEQKRREHRAHVLELLREVKEKHQHVSHV
jgi:hypothetical protein